VRGSGVTAWLGDLVSEGTPAGVRAAPELVLDGSLPLAAAAAAVLRRPSAHRCEDVGVRLPGGRVAAVAPTELFVALAREHEGRGADGADLDQVLARGELSLVFQPIVALAEQSVVAVETLLRWSDPLRGPVSPATFIPAAEASGAIVPVGRWVLRNACRHAAGWDGLTVSVNVSPRQLASGGFVDDVAAAVADSGLEPERLMIELTEGVAVADLGVAGAVLAELKRLGVRIAIDDFGTGHASLRYLQRLPVDVVKIDRTFVELLATDAPAVVDAILAMTRTLGMTAIAEGVEDASQHRALVDLGCSLGQGYFYARPMTAEQVTGLLAVPLAA
jgi:EAL domain-containing protein (putative c-di-GMP-specific phosphodiesterase class I)